MTTEVKELFDTLMCNYDFPEEFAAGLAEFLYDEGYTRPNQGEWLVAYTLREDADGFRWSSYSCSKCEYTTDAYYNDPRDISKFCPNCGAKMIKE